jgi:Arc/MetJ-type ribon-helix-helix transcriptional regulator
VKLPKGLVKEIDDLVEGGKYMSRSDFMRTAARVVCAEEKKSIHQRAEDYAYREIKEGKDAMS